MNLLAFWLLIPTAIINEIHIAKYFSIIIDVTPDCSHQEQTTFIITIFKRS